jgi:uncharacterized membrane protein SpoIIM required for sporulation
MADLLHQWIELFIYLFIYLFIMCFIFLGPLFLQYSCGNEKKNTNMMDDILTTLFFSSNCGMKSSFMMHSFLGLHLGFRV